MTDWIRIQPPSLAAEQLGPLQLAWLGDSIWEFHHRLQNCRCPGRVKDLHLSVVAEVKASAQAEAVRKLDPFLSEEEKVFIRRGRNSAGKGPRGTDPAEYGLATGFETMIGWLFLKNPERLAELLDQLGEADSASQ